ncbi:MAG TPA: amidohydrolase family protein [Myxococcaceae bacterium]|nr:amidohydrolase family protein [Myxococcaceae bacterium]
MSRRIRKNLPPRAPIESGLPAQGPVPPGGLGAAVRREVERQAAEHAPKMGLGRREFLQGPCGVAAALLALNALSGCRAYKVDKAAVKDVDAARAALAGNEFILDAQTHHLDATRDAVWPRNNPFYASMFERINDTRDCGTKERFGCLSREAYVDALFNRSDTAMAVLCGIPAVFGKNPLDNDELLATRDEVNKRLGGRRVLATALVMPNGGPRELEGMLELAEKKVAGWNVYSGFGPRGYGWFLDDPNIGTPFLEQVRKTKIPRVFCAKGLSWPNFDTEFITPKDVGPAAKAFGDVQFIIYHSGYDKEVTEGPYDPVTSPQTADQGVNRLIKSLEENGLWPDQNVYAELGGTWSVLMGKPVEAAHVIGKLLKHVGVNRVLWGTDAVFAGPPQPQIEAFRAFQIPEELQEKHGYPALTPELKARILGLNAAALLGVEPGSVRQQPGARDKAGNDKGGKRTELGPENAPGGRTRRELLLPWEGSGRRAG